jgi:hypothetical protein
MKSGRRASTSASQGCAPTTIATRASVSSAASPASAAIALICRSWGTSAANKPPPWPVSRHSITTAENAGASVANTVVQRRTPRTEKTAPTARLRRYCYDIATFCCGFARVSGRILLILDRNTRSRRANCQHLSAFVVFCHQSRRRPRRRQRGAAFAGREMAVAAGAVKRFFCLCGIPDGPPPRGSKADVRKLA